MKIANRIIAALLAATSFPLLLTQMFINIILSVSKDSTAYTLIKTFAGEDSELLNNRLGFQENLIELWNRFMGKTDSSVGIDLREFLSTLPPEFDSVKKFATASLVFICIGAFIALVVVGCAIFTNAYKTVIGLSLGGSLSFFDAAAPIVSADSVDMKSAFTQSRYDRGGEDDYINCPMNKEEYEAFYEELINAESAPLHSFDKKKDVYEGCMPIEVLASRGKDTMRFGPLKPVGLVDPRTSHRPWAALQLRKENADGTMYNLVGFQTNLKFGEQKRVFSMIPALKNAEFLRYGVMHRNTFIDSPRHLNGDFSFGKRENLFFAGQITGVEGYMESAASGIMAGINTARRLEGKESIILPPFTMIGALSRYISDESVKNFQPMGANFGVLPPLRDKIRDKKLRYEALAQRSMDFMQKEAQNI